MELTPGILKQIIQFVRMTAEQEIGCDTCFEELHEFAEMELAGKSPAEAKPLVKEHLERCQNCREEYEALLVALGNLEIKENY